MYIFPVHNSKKYVLIACSQHITMADLLMWFLALLVALLVEQRLLALQE